MRFKPKLVSLFSGQHNEPWYVKLNPEGTHIPVLCCDDKVIVEPSEIIDFISKQAEGAGKLTLCMLGTFSCFCCRPLTFQIYLFQKILSGTLSECQKCRFKIRTDILLVLIWV